MKHYLSFGFPFLAGGKILVFAISLMFAVSISASVNDTVRIELTSSSASVEEDLDDESGDYWSWSITGKSADTLDLHLSLYGEGRRDTLFGTFATEYFDTDMPEYGEPNCRIEVRNTIFYMKEITATFEGGISVVNGRRNLNIDATVKAYKKDDTSDTTIFIFTSNMSAEQAKDTVQVSITKGMSRCRLQQRGSYCRIDQILASDDNYSLALISNSSDNVASPLTHYATKDFATSGTSFHKYELKDGNRVSRNIAFEQLEVDLYRVEDSILGDAMITTINTVYLVHFWYKPVAAKETIEVDLTDANASLTYQDEEGYSTLESNVSNDQYEFKLLLRTDHVSDNQFFYEHFMYYTSTNYLKIKSNSTTFALDKCLDASAEVIQNQSDTTYINVSILTNDSIRYNIRLLNDGTQPITPPTSLIENQKADKTMGNKLIINGKVYIQKGEDLYDTNGIKQ